MPPFRELPAKIGASRARRLRPQESSHHLVGRQCRGATMPGRTERCPSGLRSATGNRVRVARRVAGSNPALSALFYRGSASADSCAGGSDCSWPKKKTADIIPMKNRTVTNTYTPSRRPGKSGRDPRDHHRRDQRVGDEREGARGRDRACGRSTERRARREPTRVRAYAPSSRRASLRRRAERTPRTAAAASSAIGPTTISA